MTRITTYQAPTSAQYQVSTTVPQTYEVDEPQTSQRYVSVFDDPARFAHSMRMAEILANSLFVPGSDKGESFRNNPSNCLIALDLAGRLNLAPTALFPHLYVIHGRPALSAQFVIALVNRSGRFTRIQWDEGVNGEVTVDLYGKQRKIPNYYAEAYFTDTLTGETLRSTRVDVELARRSGWLSKDGSKWIPMPKEMCRWRSASWLCKNYAPELVLGLEIEDEVRDAEATPIDAPAVRNVVATLKRQQPVDDSADEDEPDQEAELLSLISDARTLAELSDAANKIGGADVDSDVKSRLRLAYKKRREELANATQEEEVVIEEAPKPKPTRKRAAKKEPEPAPEVEEVSYIDAIAQAPTLEDLGVIVGSIDATFKSGAISEEKRDQLLRAASIRERDLTADAQAAEEAKGKEPTERQIKNAETLYEGIKTANDPDKIQKAREAIADARERGLITNAQAVELFDAVQDVAGGLLF